MFLSHGDGFIEAHLVLETCFESDARVHQNHPALDPVPIFASFQQWDFHRSPFGARNMFRLWRSSSSKLSARPPVYFPPVPFSFFPRVTFSSWPCYPRWSYLPLLSTVLLNPMQTYDILNNIGSYMLWEGSTWAPWNVLCWCVGAPLKYQGKWGGGNFDPWNIRPGWHPVTDPPPPQAPFGRFEGTQAGASPLKGPPRRLAFVMCICKESTGRDSRESLKKVLKKDRDPLNKALKRIGFP